MPRGLTGHGQLASQEPEQEEENRAADSPNSAPSTSAPQVAVG
jgi:hypothetical protein